MSDGNGDFDGLGVVVTGGNSGIGLAIAADLGRAGARVVIWGRRADVNAGALRQLELMGVDAAAVSCDVTDECQVVAAFAESVELVGGRVHTVFANAGRSGDGTSFTDLTLAQWREVTATNLDGTFLTLREGARHMIANGGGALVAVASTAAIHGSGGNEAYGAAKTGVVGLVRASAVSLARHSIRVNALVPGWTVTELSASYYENERTREAMNRRIPARRWARPDDMLPAARFLADPDATYHTGDTIVVDGGYTIL